MFLTVFYAAATWVQSWRLTSLKTRILQLTSQNGSIVLYKVPETNADVEGSNIVPVPGVSSVLCENVEAAKLGDLLWTVGDKRLCSVFPKQTVCASKWIRFSHDGGQFPLPVPQHSPQLSEETLHVLIEADFQENSIGAAKCLAYSEFCQLEKFGVLRAWKAGENFGLLLESDVEHLTSLGLNFMQSTLTLEDGMEVLRIETVDVNGEPCPLLNADSIPVPRSLQQPSEIGLGNIEVEEDIVGMVQPPAAWMLMSPVQWRSHVELLRSFSAALEDESIDVNTGIVMGSDRTPNFVPIEPPPTPPSSPQHDSPSFSYNTNSSEGKSENSMTEQTNEVPSVSEPQDSIKSSGVTSHSDSYYSCASQEMNKLSASLEQLSKALGSVIDEQTNGVEKEEEEIAELPKIRKSSQDTITSLDSHKLPSFKSSSISLPTCATPRSRSPSSPIRCPNVLVLSDSKVIQENVKFLLRNTLKKYRYTVYNVHKEQLKGHAWQISTALVVICGIVPDSVVPSLVSYLLSGGKLLCLCSDLLKLVLPELQTSEIKENELVSFSYQKWSKIKMLHHVLSSGPMKTWTSKNTSAVVELKDRQGVPHKLDVTVLGKEDTWHTPSLILAKDLGSGGKIIFSQVRLEVDPDQYENDHSKYSILKQSNKARFEIMRDLLRMHLGIECADSHTNETFKEAYFLGKHELKMEFLASIKSRLDANGNALKMDNLLLQFHGKGVTPPDASNSLLPILLHSCPPHFNTLEYFDTLMTESLGRLVIYADVMTSSMEPLKGAPLFHGLAAVSRLQVSGRGRGSNEWLSPDGCAMFSLQLILPLQSNLGQRIPLIQHIVALSIVLAIREAPGYEGIDLRLKWPNDIYAGDWAKIGGLIVDSTIMDKKICCNIGCGLNLSNSEPTTCIQDLLHECGSTAPPMSLEKYLALVFTRLESLIELAQHSDNGLDEILQVYYAYWLHSGAEVTVLSETGSEQRARIQGLDEFGFLLVTGEDGNVFSVHPDGNSFDMLQGLIKPKT